MKIPMGQIVSVHTEFRRAQRLGTNMRAWKQRVLHEPRAGWIVGSRSIQDGTREFISEEEGCAFHQTARHPCVLVAYWPTLKPVQVPLDGYLINPNDCPCVCGHHVTPYPPNGSPKEREVLREFYQKYINNFPRDQKGRFT